MDKRLLDALENLSLALEEIATAIDDANRAKAKSNVGSALSSGNLDSKVELINKGVKQLLDDNKKIIKNQETLMSMAKEKKEKSIFSEAGEKTNQNKIKDGLSIILAIAVGVLAIGLAFKLIGSVNFVSVIALSIALPLLALAYGIIAKQDATKVKGVIAISTGMSFAIFASSLFLMLVRPISFSSLFTSIMIAGVLVVLSYSLSNIMRSVSKVGIMSFLYLGYLVLIFSTLALAIAVSSRILNFVVPVSFFKLFTAILIAGVFSVLSYGLKNIITSLSGIGFKQLALIGILPMILLTLSMAIVLSSEVLNLVKPVGLGQLFTAILISAVFVGLSYGLKNIFQSVEKINVSKIQTMSWVLPLLFVAMSAAIAFSSPFLAKTVVVGFFVLLTAALISLIFIPLAYSVSLIAKTIHKVKAEDVWKIPVIMVAMAVAVMLTSWIFSMSAEVSFIKTLRLGWLALIMVGIAFVLEKLYSSSFGKLDPAKAIKSGLVLLIIAATITAASIILSFGTYEKYPSLWWTLKVGAAMVIFGLAVLLLGIAIQLVGIKTMLIGAAAMIILSIAITVVSRIISFGDYESSYPGVWWTVGVGLALVGFGIIALALGYIFKSYYVYGLIGILAMLILAVTIVAISHILAKGSYQEYPPLFWTLGAIVSIGAFAIAALALGLASPLFFTLGLLGISAMVKIANTIVKISKILAEGEYDTPGLLTWVIATSMIYLIFTPLLVAMGALSMASGITSFFTGGTVNPMEQAKTMMLSIADLIVKISHKLSGGNYTEGPTETWAKGIVMALDAFSTIYQIVAFSSFLTGGGLSAKDYQDAIEMIADGINYANDKFSTFSQKPYPSKDWAEGVGGAIGAFAPVYKILADSQKWFFSGPSISDFRSAIEIVSEGISVAAGYFSTFAEGRHPSREWAQGVGLSIRAFAPVYEILAKSKGWFTSGPTVGEFRKAIEVVCDGIVSAAEYFGKKKGSFSMENAPPVEWSRGVGLSIRAFLPVFEFISKNAGWFDDGTENLKSAISVTADGIAYTAQAFKKMEFPSDFKSSGGFTEMLNCIRMFAKLASENIAGKLNFYNVSPIGASAEYINKLSKIFKETANDLEDMELKPITDMFTIVESFVSLASDVIGPKKEILESKAVNELFNQMGKFSKKFKGITDNMEPFDKEWMKNVASTIKTYVNLAMWLEGKDLDYSKVKNTVDNMQALSWGYSRFADGLSRLNDQIERIDIDKLSALKNFTGSIVLMSLMDSVQFEKMMEALEDKTSIFVDVINDIDRKSEKKARSSPLKLTGVAERKSGEKSKEKSMNDLLNVMKSVDKKMSTLVNYGGQFSSYISELRTGEINLKGSGASGALN